MLMSQAVIKGVLVITSISAEKICGLSTLKKMSTTDNSLSWINYPDELSISIEALTLEKEASNLIYIRLRNQTLKLAIDDSVGFKMDYHKMLFDTLKVHCIS